MNKLRGSRILPLAVVAALLWASASGFCADAILFIGNSFTFAALAPAVQKLGGVPKLVEAIAAAKGKSAETAMVVRGGKDFGYHLQQPETEKALAAKEWNWVVLQDYSTKPTHMGNLAESLANAEVFSKRIWSHSPAAGVVLYETWARGKDFGFYTGVSSPKSFVDPEEMTTELQKGYAEMKRRLAASEPGAKVRIARVGSAFALSQKLHPEINLYAIDRYHASKEGYYLSALVIYGTIYQDSPLGAIREFPGVAYDADVAAKLQEIAAEILKN